MPNNKKVSVSIYCKIYTDNFNEDMVNRMATGDEIFEFLMKDAGQCFDESGNLLPGDCNLWYLGCNEKYGFMVLEFDKIWTWEPGESYFGIPLAFVIEMFNMRLITNRQFQILADKIDEGRLIDNMYDILDYLICKKNGKPWSKTEEASTFRDDIKRMVGEVKKSFKNDDYQFFI